MSDELKLTVDSVMDEANKATQQAQDAVQQTQDAAQPTPDAAPTLNITPTPDVTITQEAAPDAAAAAVEMPAMPVAPDIQLTIAPDPVTSVGNADEVAKSAEAVAEMPVVKPEDVKPVFTPAEQKAINDFVGKIDVTDANLVFSYGAQAQQQIASFSDSALKNVQTQDLGEVGEMISGLVTELRGFTVDDEDKGFFGFFKRAANKLEMMKSRYDHAQANVDKIVDGLEGHQVQLLKDIATLDQLYQQNLTYFKQLSMYIEAGKKRLEQVRTVDLAAAKAKAETSKLPEDAQAANDLAAQIDRFEKKIHDLELTRNISIQMAPQIRLLQNSNQLMAEKIQSSLVNTIPLWKSQMVLALGM